MDKRWVFVGMIALAVGIPRAIEAQRQTPRVPVEDKGTEQRLAEFERKLEMLARAMEKQGSEANRSGVTRRHASSSDASPTWNDGSRMWRGS